MLYWPIEKRHREPMVSHAVTQAHCLLSRPPGDKDNPKDCSWRTVMALGTSERDPRHHTQKMQQRLQELSDHLRQDIDKVDEPQLRAMFETAAEVLGGLKKAFRDYEQKNESAWRR
jgi:hypothetical protein